MEIIYTRAMNRNYMNLRVPGAADTAAYPVQILVTGKVPGVLPAALTRIDNCAYLSFDITGYQTLSTLCERHLLSHRELRTITGSLLHTLNGLRPYLLDLMQVPLTPDYIFLHWDTNTVLVPYQPFPAPEETYSLSPLFEYLLSRIDPSDTEALLLCSRLFRASLGPGAAPEELLQLFEIKEEEPPQPGPDTYSAIAESSVEMTYLKPAVPAAEPVLFREHIKTELPESTGRAAIITKGFSGKAKVLLIVLVIFAALLAGCLSGPARLAAAIPFICALLLILTSAGILNRKNQNRKKPEQRKETDIPEPLKTAYPDPVRPDPSPAAYPQMEPVPSPSFDETTVLSLRAAGPARLVPADGNPHPVLLLPPHDVTVGSRQAAADLVIPEPTVSRLHARISYENGVYRIADLNSTNGTEVNDETVVGKMSVRLKDGDRVRVAGLTYVYQDRL